jgi:hypothetical protein
MFTENSAERDGRIRRNKNVNFMLLWNKKALFSTILVEA